jgi:hypothetical protein
VQPVPTAFVAPVATTQGITTPVDLTVPLQWPLGLSDVLTINVTDDFVVARCVFAAPAHMRARERVCACVPRLKPCLLRACSQRGHHHRQRTPAGCR